MNRLLSILLTIFVCISLFSACSSDKETPSGDITKNQTESTEASSSSKDEQSSQDAGEKQENESALGKIEVIEKDDGTKVARSETGLEVEYSEESLMELYGEYEAVSGKDSEKEEELLEKIQLILDSQIVSTPAE